MPRGKNYVNNNRGVFLQSSAKKNASVMEACFYGAGCTRRDCIYRHPAPSGGGSSAGGTTNRSTEPCMAFLAGYCSFAGSGGCRKRHPDKAERERLVAKYQTIPCRYGESCKTKGCLYIHPGDAAVDHPDSSTAAATTTASKNAPAVVPAGSAWKAEPMPGVASQNNGPPMIHTTPGMVQSSPGGWYGNAVAPTPQQPAYCLPVVAAAQAPPLFASLGTPPPPPVVPSQSFPVGMQLAQQEQQECDPNYYYGGSGGFVPPAPTDGSAQMHNPSAHNTNFSDAAPFAGSHPQQQQQQQQQSLRSSAKESIPGNFAS